jgi:hypothetical protein
VRVDHGQNGDVGFNPYRKFRARPADYLLIAVVLAGTGAMVAWAIFG